MISASRPRAHADPAFLAAKIARLDEPHIAPLSQFVRNMRSETGGEVPWFDPDSGGVHARALFLYEAPGARSTSKDGPRRAVTNSGIISPDNADPTAENSWLLYQETALPRHLTVVWNIVPWYVGSPTKIRTPDADDVLAAQPYLDRLVRLLPDLRVVVVFGAKARDGWLRYLLRPDAPLLPTLACTHPSPQALNTRPWQRTDVVAALRRVAQIVQDG